jgi:hypothetical protein
MLARLLGPGGIRSVVAESVLIKQELLILNRSRQRAPNLRSSDRLVAGLCALLIRPARLIRSAIVLKPSTLLSLHRTLRNRKYRLLFSSNEGASSVQRDRPENSSRPLSRQTAQSDLGLSANCSAGGLGFQHPNRQRHCSKDSRRPLSTRTGPHWTLLAQLHWTSEGQPMEYRPDRCRKSKACRSIWTRNFWMSETTDCDTSAFLRGHLTFTLWTPSVAF